MIQTMGLRSCALAVGVLSLHAILLAQQPSGRHAALLVSVTGDVELTDSGRRDSKPQRLDPIRHVPRELRVGDHIRCLTPEARAVIFVENQERPIPQCMKGYTVPATYASELSAAFRTGGLPRGGFAGFVLWPVDGVRTRAQTASRVEWRVQPKGVLTLTLRAGSPPRTLWTRANVDATTGRFHDAELEAALVGIVTRDDAMPVLEVRAQSGMPATIALSLLGGAEDRQVQERLSGAVAGASGPVANLLRAAVLLQAGLQREALDEHVAALQLSPQSLFLLDQAAALATALGDPRAADLRDRAAQAATPAR